MESVKKHFSELGKKGQETLTKLGTRYKFTPEDHAKGGSISKRPPQPKLDKPLEDKPRLTMTDITRRP